MTTHYKKLANKLLAPGTAIYGTRPAASSSVTLKDGADSVFTDFRYIRPFSISATASIDEVNDKMIACGVRLLFVGDGDGVLQGLVTYTDVFGEKPVNYLKEHGGKREEILAQDIMTPLAQLEALEESSVRRASVGDIVETIKAAGRQHMLVNETQEDGSQLITGIFSSTHIEKLLGMKIELLSRANTFADIERALA